MNRKHRYAGVFAILALLASLAPATVLASEATVNTQQDARIVFTMIILLLGAVAAALFFASPLRKRLTGEDREPAETSAPRPPTPAAPRQPTPRQQQPAPTSRPESSTSTESESSLWWGQPPDAS